jgi:hypothetical protein
MDIDHLDRAAPAMTRLISVRQPPSGQSAIPPAAQIAACPPLHPGWQNGFWLDPLVGQQ